MDQHGWAVVIAKSSSEEVAEKSLRQQFRTYLPMSRQIVRGSRYDDRGRRMRPRGELIERPAFRGYLFIELWPDQPWRFVLDSRVVRGVAGMILCGDTPSLVPPALIERFRERENLGDFDEPKGLRCKSDPKSKRRDDLEDGAIVRIGEGPFAGFLAELRDQDEAGRARLLLSVFGRQTQTTAGVGALELVGA